MTGVHWACLITCDSHVRVLCQVLSLGFKVSSELLVTSTARRKTLWNILLATLQGSYSLTTDPAEHMNIILWCGFGVLHAPRDTETPVDIRQLTN